MPRLLIFREDNVERQLDLTNRDLRIGRGKENDIVLEDPSKAASRMHAELRYENGSYFVIDLNSQNGTWMQGERVQRAMLQPGVPITIGPFSLMLEGATAAAPHETMVGRGPASVETPAPAARPSGTLIGRASAAGKPARTKLPPKPGQAPVQPGLIAAIARLPKPVIFGGFAVVIIFTMVLGQLFAPADPNAPAASKASEAAQEARPAGRSNAEIIAEHLAAGTEMLERDPEGAIRDHIDRILLIDRNHSQALDLKAKAEDRIQQLKLAASTPASTIPANPANFGPASTSPGATSTPPSPVPTPSTAPSQTAAAAPASTIPAAPARSTATTIPRATSGATVGRAASAVPAARGARGDSDSTLVARRPKETDAAWRARSQAVQTQYQNARAALDRGDFPGAISGFEAILRDEPGYQDSQALLSKAQEGQQAEGRQAARQAFEAAIAADVAGNWTGAIQQFERARQLDVSLAPQADDGMRRTREKMRVAGSEAFKRARQYDALGRTTDAIAQYNEAATLLPPDDPNSKAAKDRLNALRGGK